MSNIASFKPRPIAGVWPPCPPVPLADCMSGLEQCYADVKRAQAFIKQMLIDIINCDPSIIGRGTPIIGVTDGSDAQPGMVGEWVLLSQQMNFGTGSSITNITMGSLSPGDWDVGGYTLFSAAAGETDITLNPVPPGFTSAINMWTSVGGAVPSPMTRALTSAPSLIAYTVNIAGATDTGIMDLFFVARRAR